MLRGIADRPKESAGQYRTSLLPGDLRHGFMVRFYRATIWPVFAAKFAGTVIVLTVILIVSSRTIHRMYEGAW